MDLSVKTKDLQDALSMAAATTDRGKSLVPIVTQVFLTADAKKETLTIRSTDAERAVTSVVPCSVKTAGDINLEFSRVNSVVNLLSDEDIRLRVNKHDRLEISSGGSSARIPVNTLISWPRMDTADGLKIEVSASSLANALRQMMPIINAKDEGMIEISARPGVLRLVALNLMSPHKFGITEVASPAPDGFRLMVHHETAQAVRKMLAGTDGMATIQLGKNGASVSTEAHTLYFLSRDKRMPDIERVLEASKREKFFQVEVRDFVAALKRTLNFSRGEKDMVAGILFGAKNKSLSLSFAAQDCESDELLDTDLAGNSPAFKVNGDYVLSFVGEIWSKSVEFRYGSNKDPIRIKPADAEYPLMIAALIDPRM